MIEWTSRFKKDYRREKKGQYHAGLDVGLSAVFSYLMADNPLSEKYRDHALTGVWKDHRDYHIKPDLVLIYCKPDADTLRLVRLGPMLDGDEL